MTYAEFKKGGDGMILHGLLKELLHGLYAATRDGLKGHPNVVKGKEKKKFKKFGLRT